MVEETERLPSARPLVAVLLLLLAGAPAVLHAQSSPWISIELSPGRNVPRNTEVTATITLSNLDVDSYTSVVFRADLTVYNRGEQRCDGDDTGKDMEKAVDQSRKSSPSGSTTPVPTTPTATTRSIRGYSRPMHRRRAARSSWRRRARVSRCPGT